MSGGPCLVHTEKREGPKSVGPRVGDVTGGGDAIPSRLESASAPPAADTTPIPMNTTTTSNPTIAKATTILSCAQAEIADGREDAFLVMDMGVVREQAARWRRELPRVQPLYAVKCNPDVQVIKTLAKEGCGFDVASKREMELVIEHAVPLGLRDLGRNTIYANPCKQVSHIRAISKMGAEMTTLDNVDEVRKIHSAWPTAKLVVRILGADDSSSVCQFNSKFGADVATELPGIIAEAKRLGMPIVGISFHVGSGATSPVPFYKAIENAKRAFDMIEAAGMPRPTFLDLGGGWPGTLRGSPTKYATFEDIAAHVRAALDKFFPLESGVRVVAEPGRYFVASAGNLYTSVHGRRALYADAPELVPNGSTVDGASTGSASDAGDAATTAVSSPKAANIVRPCSAPLSLSSPASAEVAAARAPRGYRLYINEGTYGSFNAIMNDHIEVQPGALIHADGKLFDGHGPLVECSLWGPTCDGVDKISSSMPRPELQIGDWIEWPCMGAYTVAAAAAFNGLNAAATVYINVA